MYDVVREVEGTYHVPFFNPGSNRNQRSVLRLVNPGEETATITITGQDDAGDEGVDEYRLQLRSGARMLNAQELETEFGDGMGKWHLTVESSATGVWVMNLLQTPTGHLTNLSTEGRAPEEVEPPPPMIPSVPTASASASGNRVTFSATASDGATKYRYRYGTSASLSGNGTETGMMRSATHTLAYSTRYSSQWAAGNDAGWSDWSNVARVMTVAEPKPVQVISTACSASIINGVFSFTISGRVRANRAVSAVNVIGYLNGRRIGNHYIGSMSAGETANYSISTRQGGGGSCSVSLEYR
jgi:hypothetical protein